MTPDEFRALRDQVEREDRINKELARVPERDRSRLAKQLEIQENLAPDEILEEYPPVHVGEVIKAGLIRQPKKIKRDDAALDVAAVAESIAIKP